MIRICKTILLFFVTASACSVQAQTGALKAPLDSVKESGFYNIFITPEPAAHLRTDFGDLRISDGKNENVPYILRPNLPLIERTAAVELAVLQNKPDDSGRSVLVLQYTPRAAKTELVDNISLYIKNNTVSRRASVSGSSDNVHWYIINDDIVLAKMYEGFDGAYIQSVNFPPSNYVYFKLVIDNRKSDPLNILKAVFVKEGVQHEPSALFTANPLPHLTQTDSSDHSSYIRVQLDATYHTDKISLKVSGPKFFERQAYIFLPGKGTGGMRPVVSFKITQSSLSTELASIKEKDYWIVIANGDNPPLKVTEVQTWQTAIKATAYLEKGVQYALIFGNENMQKPEYDLEKFRDSIPSEIRGIAVGTTTINPTLITDHTREHHNRQWLWPAIIAALAVLGFVTWKLLGDMKKTGS